MNRPPLLRPVFKGVPAELRAVPRWLLWRPEWVEKAGLPEGGKWNKIPVDAKTGGAGSSTNPDTWADFDTAREAYEKAPKRWGGVGFVLVADDSLMGGDCDRVIAEPPEGGSPVLSDAAAGYVAALRTYWEVSPSGRGLRFFAFAEKPEGACKRGELEMYDSGRFLTVTGRHWPAAPPAVLSCAPEVAALHALWFPAPPPRPQAPTAPLLNLPKAGANGSGHTSNGSGHVFGSVAAWSDDKLLSKIRASPAQGAKFERLWYGDNSDHAGDDSAGDAALAAILLWWTNYDAARAEQLFRQSARAQREKVAARADYLIPHAIESVMAKWDGRPGYDPGVEMDLGSGGKGKKPGFREFGEFNELTPVSENDPWEAPIPFTGAGGAALPPFPVDALPSWLGEYVSDVAVAIEVPPDLPAALSLSVLATSVQKKVEVEVKPGYREPLNLWTVTALESGGRKSSTVDEVSAPVVVYEAEENRRREGEIAAAESDRAILEDRLKDAQRRAVKEKLAVERGAAQDEARELARQLREAAVPLPRSISTPGS